MPVLQQAANLEYNLFGLQETIGLGRVEQTEPIGFGYEYTDVGRDALSPVTDDYPLGDTMFTGTIKWIEWATAWRLPPEDRNAPETDRGHTGR